MTRKDFELIARTLAYCEAHAHQDQGGPERTAATIEAVEWITGHLSDALKAEHPRFDAGRFQKAANPIRSDTLKRAILAKPGA